jgi:hypothetical protein
MVSDTDGDDLEPGAPGYEYPDPESYWRRRFFILVGGLVLVGGITWVLSVMAGPVKPIQVAGKGHVGPSASLSVRDTLPAAAYGAPSGAASAGGPSSGGASAAATPGAASSGSASGGGSATAPAASGRTCSPASIVLSLFTTQSRYSAGQQPRFEVYAVSTALGTCELAYGPSAVRVVVTRKGQVMWDSAACAPQGRAPVALGPSRFTQGVPRVTAITWDRRASSIGCAGAVPAGATGAFDAVAMADGMSSQVRAFSLSR